MKNLLFDVTVEETTGFVSCIKNNHDKDQMNWCFEEGQWGRLHANDFALGSFGKIPREDFVLESLEADEHTSTAVYKTPKLAVTVIRTFRENGNYVEKYVLKNITPTVICVNRDNFGIETPFNDRYTYADDCMVHRCNTHIWCGHHVTWVNALKMGESDINLGMFVTKGAIDCYSQNACNHSKRGIFVLNPESLMLKSGEEYEIEFELFWHTGTEDFFEKLKQYDTYIGVEAEHYTVFSNEKIKFCLHTPSGSVPSVVCNGTNVEAKLENGQYCVEYAPEKTGEHIFTIRCGNILTHADFMVKMPFDEFLEKRIHFIVDHQQCKDPESPLYGAFLVYDNETDSMYFDYFNPDHNANRERLAMSFLLIKYLQFKPDPKIRAAVDLLIQFIFREIYEETTGEVFNTVGKNRDQLRLYNAPGVMLLFAEMYRLTGDKAYLTHIVKLAENYYGIGGKTCYGNGIDISLVLSSFVDANMEKEANILRSYFESHAQHIMSNGTSYPKHEVNYEQTIVTPAVKMISDMGMFDEDKETYKKEAQKHIEVLKRFSGMQPSYLLNEIAIRFWDDYWFGKGGLYGDTLPHHLSCLTARSYMAYSEISGEKEWLRPAEECVRNCMCLIDDEGRGHAAYVYPYKLDGVRGQFYDAWSNDQDLTLYIALSLSKYCKAFEI